MEVPIQTIHLFPKLDEKLIELLRSLTPEDWNKPTLAKQWTVKDIASHLLDGNIRVISQMRDHYVGDPPGKIESYQDLVDYLNRLNADWVKATKRLSPGVLIELLEITRNAYHEQLSKLDPFAPAMFAVSWAGQTESPNWFHVAREFTEKWHHQQQIREATGKPGIMTREFFYPVIDTFMQALPYTYRNLTAPSGTCISITITSDCGGTWSIVRAENVWRLDSAKINPETKIKMHANTAWKLFTKGISSQQAELEVTIEGNVSLGKPILTMLTVMA
ncbi:MAG: maleylpyruvate isomerase N-terminal domain-containing protein [Cyclobacteriaceae bacterium]|mgnify:CR=1 FL=1|nr:maleylpyruvate isomerase N-terminal domain-containing protein [Cyclobacteriaceae bacterium]